MRKPDNDIEHPHIPLAVKYESLAIESEAKRLFGFKTATEVAIAVALCEAYAVDMGVSYSRSRKYYDERNTHPLLTYRRTRGAADALEGLGLIEHYRQEPGKRGFQSWMKATDDLASGMVQVMEGRKLPLHLPSTGLLLRDSERVPIALPNTREVSRMNKNVARINEGLVSVEARQPSGLLVSSAVARIFNSDLSRGGRFYAFGTSWQNIKSDARKRITIDGERVAELDFATLHPAMLYAEVGAPLPADCYTLGDWSRKIVKFALLVLLNAKNIQSARSKIAAEVDFGFDDWQQRLARSDALIRAIKDAHRPIAHCFHSDAGARLMRRDSDMAQAVLLDLNKQGIVALPVHDSFLVPASKRDELETAMLRAAHRFGLAQIRVDEVAS